MKKDYIIWTPAYSVSNGVKVLHMLYKELEKRGYNVYLYSCQPYQEGYNYIEEVSDEQKENAVVIYPEAVTGNPLKIKNVARYVLYYPGLNGGEKKFHQSEALFTHLPMFYPNIPVFTWPWLNEELFYDENLPKTQDCSFVYKGGKFRDAKETEGLLEINLDFPATRKELADLLRTTGTLYSYDNCTAILEEATLCGAKVKIITKEGVEDYHSTYKEETKDFEEQISNFIKTTQSLDFKGKIEGIKLSTLKDSLYFKFKYALSKYIIKDDKKAEKYKARIRGF
jgi:hypothetical protein